MFVHYRLPASNKRISWLAIQKGRSNFAIFGIYNDEAGRNAHLNAKLAAALMEKTKAGTLFVGTPRFEYSEFSRTSNAKRSHLPWARSKQLCKSWRCLVGAT
jgi:hypothetical protein